MFALASQPGALDLFWFPISIFILGILLIITRNPPKIQTLGIILSIIGAVFVALSPFTLPTSPSSAFGQLIFFLVGPSILLIIAIIVSNNQLIKNSNNMIRTIFIVISLSWLILIFIGNPQFNNSTNKYWILWITGVEIIAAIMLFSHAYVEKRNEAKILYFLLGFSLLLLNEEYFGIPNASRINLIETGATILGTIIGIIIGILIWFYIIQKLHSVEDDLEMDDKLNPEEREMLLNKLNTDLKWLKKYEGEKNE